MKTKNLKNPSIIFSAIFTLMFLGVANAKAADDLGNQIINFVNQERVKNGLEQLKENDLLNEAAALKAQDMLGNDYFSHTSPLGVTPWYWFDQVGYSYRYAGENLGMDFETAAAVHQAWMKSEAHKENILSNKYKEIGVAVKRGIINNEETQIAVQVFGHPLNNNDLIPVQTENSSEEVKEENGVLITQSSIHFWEGSEDDEMLISAEVEGEAEKVLVSIDSEEFELEKIRENIYVNLVSTKGLNVKSDNVLIKALNSENEAFFAKVPDKYFVDYVVAKDNQEQEKEEDQLLAMLNLEKNQNNFLNQIRLWINQAGMMLLIVGLLIITIFNIWLLEKEEERLLELKS